MLAAWGEVTWEQGLEEEKEPSSDELELVIADILATAKKLKSPDGLAWEKTIKEVGQQITSTCYIWGEPYKLQEMLKNTFTYFKSFDKK